MFSEVFCLSTGEGVVFVQGGGLSRKEGSLSKGALSRGVSVTETPSTVTSGRYASHWNALLLCVVIYITIGNHIFYSSHVFNWKTDDLKFCLYLVARRVA